MAELITKTDLPHWLQPYKQDHGDFYSEVTWETALARLSAGETLTSICRDPTMPDVGRFRNWIFKDPERKQRYYLAREIGSDKTEDELVHIADGKTPDGDETMEDVQRSTLRINTRKWLLGVWNRERYGERKQVDMNVNVDLSQAMAAANNRLQGRVFEGEVIDDAQTEAE